MKPEESKPYSYFDTPDGHDIFKKLKAWLYPTSLGAAGIATIDVMLYSQPKTYLQTLGRYAFIALPLIGINTAFVVTTNSLASIRKKDDQLNWLVGGAAAGSMFGIWTRRRIVGFNMALFLGLSCAGIKYAYMLGGRLITSEETPIAEGGVWMNDWTLQPEIKGNWTTGK